MRGKRLSIGLRAALAIFALTVSLTNTWAASEKMLHYFGSGTDGTYPYAGMISDGVNFYGTTSSGGSFNVGAVFELSPNGSGGWTEKKLHNFYNNGLDGVGPSAGLVMDAEGNLYGTTYAGGDYGAGTAFKLTPNGSGGWTETKIRNFYNNGVDGAYPKGGLVFDTAGNLYGTTYFGGTHGVGMVFELTPPAHGETWKETILHYFNDNGTDGWGPSAGLIFDAAGNLYGTTAYGGAYKSGTVFELTPKTSGGWNEKVLHSFSYSSADGGVPLAGLIFDTAGNLYGTTLQGGNHGGGTVVELTIVDHRWTEQVLRNFGNGTDGAFPLGGLVLDSANPPNVYGTTYAGGIYPCGGLGCGMVFELTPPSSGNWPETVLYNFGADGRDGTYPYAGLIFDADGNLYGTTSAGGSHGDGTIFEITP
jgi:uncharacterized repeat protein (TIGR03803 family)